MTQSRRFAKRAEREINLDSFAHEWPEAGLILMGSPADPKPSLRIERGEIVEMDGRGREAFDMIDVFIARHAINLEVAEQAMATSSLELARMLVDINVPREKLARLMGGLHGGQAGGSGGPSQRGRDHDGAVEDARPPDARESGPCDQPQRLPCVCWRPTLPKRPCAALPKSKPRSASPATRPGTRWRF